MPENDKLFLNQTLKFLRQLLKESNDEFEFIKMTNSKFDRIEYAKKQAELKTLIEYWEGKL